MTGTKPQIDAQRDHKPRQRQSIKHSGFRIIKFHPRRTTASRRKVKQETLPSRDSGASLESSTATISKSLGVLKSQRINDWEWDFLSDLLVSSSPSSSSSPPSAAMSKDSLTSTSETTIDHSEKGHGGTVIDSVLEANNPNDYFRPDSSDSEESSSGAWLDSVLDYSGLPNCGNKQQYNHSDVQ